MDMDVNALRFFQAYIVLPPPEGSKWNVNKTVGIIAKDVDQAVRMVKEEYPDCAIWNIQHPYP